MVFKTPYGEAEGSTDEIAELIELLSTNSTVSDLRRPVFPRVDSET